MDTFFQDFKFALRTLRKNIGVTLLATGSLALAIAGNTTVFSMVNGFLYRPLPYEEPHRLALIGERALDLPTGQLNPASMANFLDLQERQSSFQGLGAFRGTALSLDRGEGRPEQLSAAAVSIGFFELLGSSPLFGRTFLPEEEIPGNHRVALLSHDFWIKNYGDRRDLQGETLQLNGEPYDIIGVLAADFEFLAPNIQIYTPLAIDRANLKRHQRDLLVMGRMKDGITDAQADAEMAALMVQLAKEYPESNRGYTIDVLNLREEIPDPRNALFFNLIQGALLFVLLIACANIANLLLARSQRREREIAIRTCMGAKRGRIIRQLFTESLVMALIAGSLGMLLSLGGIKLMNKAFSAFAPSFWLPVIDNRVLAFNLAVTLLGGLLFGLAPVIQTSRFNLLSSLKDGTQAATTGRGKRWVANALVVGELALALVFLAGASVMLQTFETMQNSDPGFETKNILDATIGLPATRYTSDEELVTAASRLRDQVSGLPGVQAVTVSNINARTVFLPRDVFSIEGRPEAPDQSPPRAIWVTASPGYFEAFGFPVQRGRSFDDSDRRNSASIALINQSLAERYWPDEDPLGRRISLLGQTREIVGVVADVQHGLAINADLAPVIYIPWDQQPTPGFVMSLHGPKDGTNSIAGLEENLREELQTFDRDLSVTQLKTLDAFIDQFWVGQKVFSLILTGFGALALFLAAIGTYGVLAYSVVQRTHEIGVRMAIGADRGKVVRMITGQGLALAALGMLIGIPLILWVNKAIASIFENFVPVETGSIALVALVLALVTGVASLLPALRAASVDPIEALRTE